MSSETVHDAGTVYGVGGEIESWFFGNMHRATVSQLGSLVGLFNVNWHRKNYTLAVLGARRSGKTTLINHWAGRAMPADYQRTLAPKVVGNVKDRIDDTRYRIPGLRDVSGAEQAKGEWDKMIGNCSYVVFLIDARALCGCLAWTDLPAFGAGRRGITRLQSDIELLGTLFEEHKEHHRCVLVVTHRDQDCRALTLAASSHALQETTYESRVTDELRPMVNLLGGIQRVATVVGNLAEDGSRSRMSDEVMGIIADWDKSNG